MQLKYDLNFKFVLSFYALLAHGQEYTKEARKPKNQRLQKESGAITPQIKIHICNLEGYLD